MCEIFSLSRANTIPFRRGAKLVNTSCFYAIARFPLFPATRKVLFIYLYIVILIFLPFPRLPFLVSLVIIIFVIVLFFSFSPQATQERGARRAVRTVDRPSGQKERRGETGPQLGRPIRHHEFDRRQPTRPK